MQEYVAEKSSEMCVLLKINCFDIKSISREYITKSRVFLYSTEVTYLNVKQDQSNVYVESKRKAQSWIFFFTF